MRSLFLVSRSAASRMMHLWRCRRVEVVGFNWCLICFSLHFFTDYALLSLHDGIFMLQSHAEGYLSTFTSRLRIFDNQGPRQPSPGEDSMFL